MCADTVLVTGAGGTLGRAVMAEFASRGVRARGCGRRGAPAGLVGEWARVDLLGGDGLAAALGGVEVVIHCASAPTRPTEDVEAVAVLAEAARRTGAAVLFVGIAGIEGAARHLAYYRCKLAAEHCLAASGADFAVVRATQFHDFADYILGRLDAGWVAVAPSGIALQPVDRRFVARRLADYALAGARGRLPDIHGPEVLRLQDMARLRLTARGRRSWLVPLRLPLAPFRALGALALVQGDAGGRSWDAWLADTAA